MNRIVSLVAICCLFVSLDATSAAPAGIQPNLRKALPPSQRAKDAGRGRFVDAAKGEDKNTGDEAKPWRSLTYAIQQLQPGDTLYLRGGVYYEPIRVSLQGRAEAPITIRSYPGEQAVIDGGFREFYESPATAWEPFAKGGEGEYRSTRRYPNLRHIVGSLGNSMIGLNAYYHAMDLRAKNETFDWGGQAKSAQTDVKPVYCGPGIWYDPVSGYVHARLAHTHLPEVANYTGETDARKTPLVLADFRSIPLWLDGAGHVRVQDLVIRGAGYDAVLLDNSSDILLEGLTIWAGSYGLSASRTQRLTLRGSAMYGNVPPWQFRTDGSKRAYPGRAQRDITRLNTHAVLVADAGREFSVFAHPINDDWEIDHCIFSDAHDGAYLGGINVQFHHNLVETMQDDGLYLSPMYPRYSDRKAEVQVYQNVIRQCLTALAFGGPELSHSPTLIYRNLIDLRDPVPTGRPTSDDRTSRFSYGKVMGDHGSPPWPAMKIYHNTVIARERARFGDMSLLGAAHADRPRQTFNNILLHASGLPAHHPLPSGQGQEDANLYWGPASGNVSPGSYFDKYRASEAFKLSKESYPPGYGSNSLVADPGFMKFELDGQANDYSLQANSPAVNAGVLLPAEWPDPLREQDQGKPDIGWLPRGVKAPSVGPSMP